MAPCHGSAPNSGSHATRFSPTQTSAGPRRISSGSGNKRDTVDLLQRGLAFLDRREGRLAQEARAGALRRLLERAQRRARGDELAQLVVQDHELRDRLASAVAGAATLPATLADAEI